MTIQAKIIKDSISPFGVRLTSIEATMHRFMLPEFNTHRMFSRNSASSRAIPVEKTLDQVHNDPAFPSVWPAEKPGMQGGDNLTGAELRDAQLLFEDIKSYTVSAIDQYLDSYQEKKDRLHKSVINRLLEPFMWHTVIVTSTEWDGFFNQRCHPDAQPEIRMVAECIQNVYKNSRPSIIQMGEWHMPYIDIDDLRHAESAQFDLNMHPQEILKRQSVARCARVSTLAHDGKKSIEADLNLYNRLITASPPHASPLEHVATPAGTQTPVGNFYRWHQLRHVVLNGA